MAGPVTEHDEETLLGVRAALMAEYSRQLPVDDRQCRQGEGLGTFHLCHRWGVKNFILVAEDNRGFLMRAYDPDLETFKACQVPEVKPVDAENETATVGRNA